MNLTLELSGLNLERLLRNAGENGVQLKNVRRMDERILRVTANKASTSFWSTPGRQSESSQGDRHLPGFQDWRRMLPDEELRRFDRVLKLEKMTKRRRTARAVLLCRVQGPEMIRTRPACGRPRRLGWESADHRRRALRRNNAPAISKDV